MKASSVENLSLRVCRWACLLAVAALPFSTGACIAPTGTSEGNGGNVDDSKVSADDDTQTTGTSPPPGKGPQNPNSPGNGPVFGPVPSPWAPSTGNGNPGDIGGGSGSGGGLTTEPLPSPWLGSGAASGSNTGASKPAPQSGTPSGKTE